MIPHIGIVRHDPPNSYGDCLRAAIASFFSCDEVTDVPHFFADGDPEFADALLKTWLAERGYRPFYMTFGGSMERFEIFEVMKVNNRDIPYLLFCTVGTGDHVVICKNDRVVHDPGIVRSHDYSAGSNGLWVVCVFVPIEY